MADYYFAELVQSNRCLAVSLRRLSWACTLMKGSISGFIKHRRLGEEPVLIWGCIDEAYSSDAGRPKELLKIGLDPRPMDFQFGLAEAPWAEIHSCFVSLRMLTVDEQMQDTLQRISKSAVALACLNSVSFWLKLFQLAVCMLACCQDPLDRCTTMHLRHQPLEFATRLNGFADFMISSGFHQERMEWIQNYIGMVAILGTQIWWTWQVEASGKNIQSVCHMAW